ncbi:MAG: 5'-nucleotidase C-terminal domain-containing protein [Firmicutes bacterium]|nr:5'-nucleotidase C-terminal domain-containing protein [Bacillota bacterium]
MKKKRLLCLLLVSVMALSLLAGCGGEDKESDGKQKVTVALWGSQLLENYSQFLCDEFPDVDFEFTLATNSTDYYRFMNDHDDLPDIMTVRRFSMNDAGLIKDMMYDLGDTELAATFYGTYLENYTYDDGTVNWLPACADVDSLIINETLFNEYGIPIPNDYESFVYACKEFEKNGIQGFTSDFSADYTCMEVLQGFSIAELQSMEGREWRNKYESHLTDQLSKEVWVPAFEKFFDVMEVSGIDVKETEMVNMDAKEMYNQGKVAMYRGTGTDVIEYAGREGDKSMLMPYFGETENDNWYLSYPSFQVGASKKAMEDPEREQLIIDIMEAMLSEEGQSCISYGKNMIPYNKGVNLELLPELDNIKPYIEDNKMYIRLASSEMFSISQNVVQRIIKGEIATPEEAFKEFNKLMKEEDEEEAKTVTIDKAVSNDFTEEHGNMAASAVFNTVLAESGVDLVFGQSCYVSSDIYEGDYTEKDLGYLTNNDTGWPAIAKISGKQLKELVAYTLEHKNTRGAVSNDSTLYVSAGFEMDISRTDDGYKLNKLTVNGKEMKDDAQYSVLICSDYDLYTMQALEKIGCTDYNNDDGPFEKYIYKRIVEDGGQLEEPSDYMTIK